MSSVTFEKVLYPLSTYVWCKGKCAKLGRHPIFISSPVRFERKGHERFTSLTCKQPTCSAFGQPTRYSEKEIAFQDCEEPVESRAKCA
jgi:hypothetical protein